MKGRDGLFMRPGEPFSFRWKDADDKWRERSTGTRDRKLAREAKRQFEDDLQNNAVPDKQWTELTVKEAAERWLQSRRGEIDPNTYRSYASNFSAPIAFFKNRLRAISLADIRTFRNARLKSGRHPRTINHDVDALSFLLTEANVWTKIVQAGFKALPLGKRHSSRLPLTADELNRLVTTGLSNPAWEVVLYAMLLAATTAARPCEIMQLQLGRIHLDAAYPYIVISRETTKTNSGSRTIPLNRIAQLAVSRLLDRTYKLGACQPDHYLLPRDLSRHTKQCDPLYSRRFDGWDPALYQKGWDGAWCALRKKAGMPHAEFYSLRHSALTTGAEQDVPIAVMAALAGHSSQQMTEYYQTIRHDPKIAAVEAIEKSNVKLLDILGLPREDDDSKPVVH
jgi:integrase